MDPITDIIKAAISGFVQVTMLIVKDLVTNKLKPGTEGQSDTDSGIEPTPLPPTEERNTYSVVSLKELVGEGRTIIRRPLKLITKHIKSPSIR